MLPDAPDRPPSDDGPSVTVLGRGAPPARAASGRVDEAALAEALAACRALAPEGGWPYLAMASAARWHAGDEAGSRRVFAALLYEAAVTVGAPAEAVGAAVRPRPSAGPA